MLHLDTPKKRMIRTTTKHIGRRAFAFNTSFGNRERALEEKAAREHDQMLLAKLKESLGQSKAYAVEEQGTFGTATYRLFLKKGGQRVSFWHDVPLEGLHDNHNVVMEMPLGTQEKMEVTLDEAHNPIKQDIKKGKPRLITYGPSKWNYGSMPMTWEDPNVKLSGTSFVGDGDPLDVVEIGGHAMPRGSIVPVRVVGALALIDEGELDWKIVAIAQCDDLAQQIHDIDDVEKIMPGKIASIKEWYKMYKTADGKPQNEFAFDGRFLDRKSALDIISEAHGAWKTGPGGQKQA